MDQCSHEIWKFWRYWAWCYRECYCNRHYVLCNISQDESHNWVNYGQNTAKQMKLVLGCSTDSTTHSFDMETGIAGHENWNHISSDMNTTQSTQHDASCLRWKSLDLLWYDCSTLHLPSQSLALSPMCSASQTVLVHISPLDEAIVGNRIL